MPTEGCRYPLCEASGLGRFSVRVFCPQRVSRPLKGHLGPFLIFVLKSKTMLRDVYKAAHFWDQNRMLSCFPSSHPSPQKGLGRLVGPALPPNFEALDHLGILGSRDQSFFLSFYKGETMCNFFFYFLSHFSISCEGQYVVLKHQ